MKSAQGGQNWAGLLANCDIQKLADEIKYRQRPKSERSDFGQDRFGSVPKSLGFRATSVIRMNLNKIVQLSNKKTVPSRFGTGSVRLSDVWDEPNDFKPNTILFGLSNRMFPFRTLTVYHNYRVPKR